MTNINLGEIFRLHGEEYLQLFGSRMLPGHKKALYDIAQCRTLAAGGHVTECDTCGYDHYVYHSCCNRTCPQCHTRDAQTWLEKRECELLPTPCFHLVFTVPEQLRRIIRSNQKLLYDVLIKAAVNSLKKLALDPRYLGGTLGILAVLHTWGRSLGYHPHVHCLVPAVGICADRQHLHFPKKGYLVPYKALSQIFRAKFMDMARESLPANLLPAKIPAKWVVYVKDVPNHAGKVLEYLAGYVHRSAITNNRIISLKNRKVTFKYKPVDKKEWQLMSLPVLEFMRRILQHALPKGFHKVRLYGFLAPSNRPILSRIKNLLLLRMPPNQKEQPAQTVFISNSGSADSIEDKISTYPKCTKCKKGTMRPMGIYFKRSNPFAPRPPP